MKPYQFDIVQESSYSIAEERMLYIHDDPHQPWSSRSGTIKDELTLQETISDGC